MTDTTTATAPFAHFLSAQSGATSGYVTALAELESGHKSGHWIWYILPQLAGLGQSGMSQKFAISGDIEARQYLQHPVLGPRLLQTLQVVHNQLSPPASRSLVGLMGGKVDAQKAVSCCTLFGLCAQFMLTDSDADVARRAQAVAQLCRKILDAAERQGLSPCFFTLDAMPETA